MHTSGRNEACWADKAYQLPAPSGRGVLGQAAYDRVMSKPLEERQAEFEAIKAAGAA